jgi:hypothetical protein
LDIKGIWDVTTGDWGGLPDIAPDQNGKLINGANASLEYNGHLIGLWVNSINTDFSLNGSTGQGPFTQDFYPHNLVSPSIIVNGQTTNIREKNRLSDFVRYTHSRIIKTSSTNPNHLVILSLHTNGQKGARTQKGSPTPFKVYGIIESIPFGAERFQTAQDYQFSFDIAYTNNSANSNHRFLGLNFAPASVTQLQTITQWSTDPRNKSMFEKPGRDRTVKERRVTTTKKTTPVKNSAPMIPVFSFKVGPSPLVKLLGRSD